jgi:hypothetical protein
MNIIVSQYIRTLKERNELDRLLPSLILSMGIVPLFTPQTGTRQYGVDIAAVGIDPDDLTSKQFLFVVKQKDLGRNEWDSGPQSIRQSFNDIIDVYIKNCVQPKHKKLPIKIVLTTSGDLKEEINQSWAGYISGNTAYEFDFWGADRLSALVTSYMLNENMFNDKLQSYLRKSLSLIKENDYSRDDYHSLLMNLMQLAPNGEAISVLKKKDLENALRTSYLASSILSSWALHDGNAKQALFVSERFILWAWHRINLEKKPDTFFTLFVDFLRSYITIACEYILKLQPYFHTQHAVSLYSHETSLVNITVFEQIGIVSTIGLVALLLTSKVNDENERNELEKYIEVIANCLTALIDNNPSSGSPRLDGNVIDITLCFIFLKNVGKRDFLESWLKTLVYRIDFVLKIGRNHPISSDLIDDLVEADCNSSDKNIFRKTSETSWIIPTLAGFCALFDKSEGYNVLRDGVGDEYKHVYSQLWHPTSNVYKHIYFHQAQYYDGETEVPINYPLDISIYKLRMEAVSNNTRYNIIANSPAVKAGLPMLDLIACRHFRTPVPPVLWYALLHSKNSSDI